MNQVWNWVKGEGKRSERERVDFVYWSAWGVVFWPAGATVWWVVSWEVERGGGNGGGWGGRYRLILRRTVEWRRRMQQPYLRGGTEKERNV